MIKNLLSIGAFVALCLPVFAQSGLSHFEGSLPKLDTSFVGEKGRNQGTSGLFHYSMDTSRWGTWTGWSFSSMRDTKTGDFTNDRSSINGAGANYSTTYAIGFDAPNIRLDEPMQLSGTYINNTTYAFKVMEKGNEFAKKFGGDDGTDPDSFVVRATGYLSGATTGSSDFYLADFTFSDDSKDYIVGEFTWWDLRALGTVDSISFGFISSDTGQYGINTPTYFSMDNFNGVAPDTKVGEAHYDGFDLGTEGYLNGADGLGGFYSEGAFYYNNYNPSWKSWSGFSLSNNTDTLTEDFKNQYSSFAGGGFNESDNFIVANGFGPMTIELPYHANGHQLKGVYLTNATYAALSMRNGDDIAKKFGGDSGNDEDWYKVDIIGFDYKGVPTDTIEFYLADYRFSNNSLDYIVKDWTWVDLSELGAVTKLELQLSSSDVGQYGMNTPAYICMDGFNTENPVSTIALDRPQVQLFPNPASHFISFQLPENTVAENVVIFDMRGSAVLNSTSVSSINIAELPKGQYTLRVATANEVYHAPFIKL